MSGESYVGLGAGVIVVAGLPLVLAAAGIGLAGAIVYTGAKTAEAAYEGHKKRLTEEYGVEKSQLEVLDRAVENITRARESLASRIRQQVVREREEAVNATAFGKLTVEAMEEMNSETAINEASSENSAAAGHIEGSTDFSDLFSTDIALGNAIELTAGEYIAKTRERVVGLVAFTSEERGAQERLLSRCDMLAESTLSVEDVMASLEPQVEETCAKLMEGEAELRRETFINYIAMCQLMRERPKELSFEAMAATTAEMGTAYIKQQAQGTAIEKMEESLAEVGLTNAGAVVFNGENGYLLVDENDTSCGIFMRRDDEGESYLFTTVSAQEPSRVGVTEKREILSGATRMCEKKRRLFDEVLPRAGLTVDIGYEYDPPSIEHIHKMPQFADYAKGKAGQSASSGSSTGVGNYREM